ncbi:MAG: solute:sodium symporter family transporter [Verrucomicrobiota bacterium]
MTLITFIFFTALVAVLTWFFTRGKGTSDEEGFFLAGRGLSAIVIAGSLLLTNLSTEQLVGLNGGAFNAGLSVMAWEVIAGMSLVAMALFFLPRYLKSGIATIPQFLEERYGAGVRIATTLIFIIAYTLILLPFVLFSGASALAYMLDLPALLSMEDKTVLWIVIGFIAIVGSAYAIFGGLRAVAVSDTFNGFGLLVGGLLMAFFTFQFAAGEGSITSVFGKIKAENPDAFVSLGKSDEGEHWPTLFTGVLLLNFFYWCTNQQIIQRTFGAKTLAEGQKGVLLAAFFKILAPIILILPGIAAFYIATQNPEFKAEIYGTGDKADDSKVYGTLVRYVLPGWMTGFFAAVVVGSILSTFNSVLNSSATLFSLGIYKKLKPEATTGQVVASGRVVSAVVAVAAAIGAPIVFYDRTDIFNVFQSLNGVYFIPLAAVILMGLFNKRVNGIAALITLAIGLALMVWGTFLDGAGKELANGEEATGWVKDIFKSGFHYMGAVFASLMILLLILGLFMKRDTPYVQQDAGKVDLTPWKPAPIFGGALVAVVLVIYFVLAR